ncbi:MAG: hypothetical protein P9M02_01660 [Candidatus Susulua stagnicola]|nr:hypothetical protein [Candidatus Susulua stagnicola]
MKKKLINYQQEWKPITVLVASLLLDPENIRLETERKTQDEIVRDLFVNEKAMQILLSIYENGFFPDESPVVVRENKNWVVFEGSRRVASLQAMIDPIHVPRKYKEKIRKLMLERSPILSITVRVAPNREAAMQYLAAKHTKNTKRPWSALRRAYFYYAQKEKGRSVQNLIKRYKGVNIPAYIRMYEMHQIATSLPKLSDEVRKKINNKRNFDITTLERLYSDKYVQEKMGLQFNPETGEVTIPKSQEFDRAYTIIITDIVDKIITSRKKISDSTERKTYIDQIVPKKLSFKTTAMASDFVPVKPTKITKNKLNTQGINFYLPFPAIERMYKEIERISISNDRGFPNAAHDLLRSFLECSLKAFFDLHEIAIKKKGEYSFLKDALEEFKGNEKVKLLAGSKFKALKNLITKIEQTKGSVSMMGYTANFMHQLNHSHYFFSNREAVQQGWDELKPLFMFILSSVPEKKET